jgi:glycosyltransferase involved in cell wall biosynthesis
LKTLVRAAALTRLPLWIVGTGPEEEALKKLAVESGADVTFFGYRSGLELHRLIKGARVMVLPSEWYENAPMSVMEAYALGRPALGARIGGIPELIRPGHTGDTFESGSAESLAEKMCYFSGLPDAKISELGMTGRSWVAEEFTLHRYRDRLSDLYAELGVRP